MGTDIGPIEFDNRIQSQSAFERFQRLTLGTVSALRTTVGSTSK